MLMTRWDCILILSAFTKNKTLPYDMDKLYTNAKLLQEEMDFGNASKIKKSFSSASTINVVMNEFKRTYNYGLRNHFNVIPINNNIYQLNLKFQKDFFDVSSKIYNDIKIHNKEVEINIEIDSKLYPFYPPKIRLISPRLLNHLNGRIATMECLLLSNWNPIYNIETLITHFKNLMNQYGEIDVNGGKV